ncbi:MAG: type II secretion system F family protein [archaeon]|nr:type II secretion system F family protein [archaeon]
MYERIAAFIPQGIINKFKKEMIYLGIEINERSFLGFLLLFSIALSLGISINLFLFFQIPIAVSFFAFALFFFFGTFLWLNILSENKGKFVEKILPDALQLIASNIKSGLTTERALFVSARPEFGPLEKELKYASKEILAGAQVEEVLLALPERIRSKVLERTMWLIARGIASGGQIADLLIRLSDDLREQNSIQAEEQANTAMYVMLIFFSAAFGAPLLFGISTFIVEILSVQLSTVPTIDPSQLQGISGQGLKGLAAGGEAVITPAFIMMFSIIMLVASSIFSSLTIGVINSGKEKNGVKFIPMILIISFVIFFAIRLVLATMFGDLLSVSK